MDLWLPTWDSRIITCWHDIWLHRLFPARGNFCKGRQFCFHLRFTLTFNCGFAAELQLHSHSPVSKSLSTAPILSFPCLTTCISLCGLRQPLLTLLPWHLLKVGMPFFFVVWTYLAPCPLLSVRCWSLCYPPPHRSFSRHIPKYVSRFLFYWLLWIPGKQTIGLLFALSLSLGQMLVQEVFNEWICKRCPRLFIPTSILIRTSESIALQSEKDVAGRINAEFDDIKVLMNCWNTDKEPFENLLSVL